MNKMYALVWHWFVADLLHELECIAFFLNFCFAQLGKHSCQSQKLCKTYTHAAKRFFLHQNRSTKNRFRSKTAQQTKKNQQ